MAPGASRDARLRLREPFGLADVRALCDRAERLLQEGHPTDLECDVGGVRAPDLGTVEALARVELTAKRLGADVRLRGASVELLELLALCGLPLELAPEGEREPEEREEPRGVEEERDPGDSVA
jgi:ABC-type transporter Mla MlaB component